MWGRKRPGWASAQRGDGRGCLQEEEPKVKKPGRIRLRLTMLATPQTCFRENRNSLGGGRVHFLGPPGDLWAKPKGLPTICPFPPKGLMLPGE